MTTDPTTYIPISCEFHDLLEALATTHKPARIAFRDDDGVEQRRTAVVTDVHARAGAEYLVLESGESLRLDRLVEVDGEKLADYQD